MLGSVSLLVAGLVVGRWTAPHFPPIARERQGVSEERKQLAAVNPPEQSRVAGSDSTSPKTEPPPRQETQVAGVPPGTPPVRQPPK